MYHFFFGLLSFFYVIGNQELSLRPVSPTTVVKPPVITEKTPLRIADLSRIVFALESYKRDHNQYPISSGGGKGWDGIFSSWGESRSDWIEGLAPKYIRELPRDPRYHNVPHEQYVYRSNGANYMLLAYNPDDCAKVWKLYTNLVPENRYCWAYGFWTVGATGW